MQNIKMNMSRLLKYILPLSFLLGLSLMGLEYKLNQDMLKRFSNEGDWLENARGRLFYKLKPGEQKLTFVLESGASGITANMEAIGDGLSQYGRVISYDRSGLGMSQPGVAQPSLDQIADDTLFLIDRLAGTSPVVYVGYSIGAAFVINFQRKYPG
ncbi:MAG: alpha/beta hydrolase, partial [Proteobacteria bacterium]|nr:alpha/beta hydrolase [Pseudomonadota bacterium]